MKKVTTINLAGRAFQVEESAYAAVHDYLELAKRALHKDPDQAEILADLEQSIADKCAQYVTEAKSVVTEVDMQTVLAALGPVEATEADSEPEEIAENKRRRLFLIKDGAVLAGVCKGLAVYLNVNVMIVRVLMVILAIITNGLMVIVYVLLALLLPTADDSEKMAAAYGYAATAQEVIERARLRATDTDTLNGIGRFMTNAWKVLCKLFAIAAAGLAVMATVAYGVGLWAVALGRTELVDSLAQYNGWPQWLGLTALYLSCLLPLVFAYRLFDRWSRLRSANRTTVATDLSLLAVWVVAIVSTISLITFVSADFRSYAAKHGGYIDFKQSNLCVDGSRCNPQRITDSQGKECWSYNFNTTTGNCIQ